MEERENRTITLPFAVLLLSLMGMFLLAGCGRKKQADYNGKYIYYIDANETKLVYEEYTPKNDQTEKQIEEYIRQLQKDPSDIAKKKVLLDDVKVEEYNLDDTGHLTLYMNAAYGNLTGISEILRRAAIVKTLCQVDGVFSIQFYVAGQPLTDSNMTPVGYMSEESFVDNTGGTSAYQKTARMNIYFSDTTGNHLEMLTVDITYDATIPLEQLAMEQLIKGPYSILGIDEKRALPTIPEGTELNKITIKDKTCYVDLSSEFLKKRADVSAEVTIYSVVNTLSELSTINKVQFSIDGEQALTYNETLDFSGVFERNLDIVNDNEKISNNKKENGE